MCRPAIGLLSWRALPNSEAKSGPPNVPQVRRAATKVLSAAVVSRPDKLAALVPMLAPTLVARFREREENVKMDIFSTFNDLLTQVGAPALSHSAQPGGECGCEKGGSSCCSGPYWPPPLRSGDDRAAHLREAALNANGALFTLLIGWRK